MKVIYPSISYSYSAFPFNVPQGPFQNTLISIQNYIEANNLVTNAITQEKLNKKIIAFISVFKIYIST